MIIEAGRYTRKFQPGNWRVVNARTGEEIKGVESIDTTAKRLVALRADGDGRWFVVGSGDNARIARSNRRIRHAHLCRATKTVMVLV